MNIPYTITSIQTPQFAVFPTKYTQGVKTDIQIDFGFFVHKERLDIICLADINFYQNKEIVLYTQVKCVFSIAGESATELKEKDKIPAEFLRYIATITVGAARGIISAKTENTPLYSEILPPINLVENIKDDIIISKTRDK